MPTPTHLREFPIATARLRGSDTPHRLIHYMINDLNQAATILNLFVLEMDSDSKPIHQLLSTAPTSYAFSRELTPGQQGLETYGFESGMHGGIISILGKSFVYTVDAIRRAMCELQTVASGQPQQTVICKALKCFNDYYKPPRDQSEFANRNLERVANAIRHQAERRPSQPQLKRKSQRTREQHIFATDVLIGGPGDYRLVYMDKTNQHFSVALSYDGLEIVQTCIQEIVDAYVHSYHTSTT